MKTATSLLLTLSLVTSTFAVACSEEAPSPSARHADSKSDEQSSSATTPAPASPAATASAPKAAAGCDFAAPAAMGAIASTVVIEDDSHAAPKAEGGDEKGTWVFATLTLYLPSIADGVVDVAASSVEGKGFATFDGSRFNTLSDTTSTMSTSIAGTVITSILTKAAGTYTKDGGKLTLTPECSETTAEGGTIGDTGFTRVSETAARFQFTTTSELGSARLVIDLKKVD